MDALTIAASGVVAAVCGILGGKLAVREEHHRLRRRADWSIFGPWFQVDRRIAEREAREKRRHEDDIALAQRAAAKRGKACSREQAERLLAEVSRRREAGPAVGPAPRRDAPPPASAPPQDQGGTSR